MKAVLAVRADGRRVLFGRFRSDAAETTAAALRKLAIAVEVVDAKDASGPPGEAASVSHLSATATSNGPLR